MKIKCVVTPVTTVNDKTSNQYRTCSWIIPPIARGWVSITGCRCIVVGCYRRGLPALLRMLSGWGDRHQKSEAGPDSRKCYNLEDMVGPNSLDCVRVPASRILTVSWSVHLCYQARKKSSDCVGGRGTHRHWRSTQQPLTAYGWSATLELRPSGGLSQ